MKYAIFLVKKPESATGQAAQTWRQFHAEALAILPKARDTSDLSKQFSDNLWLLSLEANTQNLAQLVGFAEQFWQQYLVLYIEDPTIFLGNMA